MKGTNRKEGLNMHLLKGIFISLVMIIALSLFLASPIMAKEFPTKPINFIVPWGPGSVVDLVARCVTNGAQKHLGQPFIVENKTGAAGAVGTQYMLSKPADGYTMGVSANNPLVVNYFTGVLKYHPADDFTHIMRLCGYRHAICVREDAPWKNIQEFIQYARANPRKITIAISGIGSTGQLNLEEFCHLANIQLTMVPYKGGDTNTALLGGHVNALSDAAWSPFVEAGKFRALVIFANNRIPRYPQVPVSREIVSENCHVGYIHLFAPKGLPKPIVKKLHDAFKMAINEPEYKNVLDKFNLDPLYLNSEDCERAIREDIGPIVELAKKIGLKKE